MFKKSQEKYVVSCDIAAVTDKKIKDTFVYWTEVSVKNIIRKRKIEKLLKDYSNE